MAEPDPIEALLAQGPETPEPERARLRAIESRVLAAAPRPRGRRRRPVWWLVGLLAAGAATAAGWWTVAALQPRSEPRPVSAPAQDAQPATPPQRPGSRADDGEGPSERDDGRTIYEREVY